LKELKTRKDNILDFFLLTEGKGEKFLTESYIEIQAQGNHRNATVDSNCCQG